MLTMIPSELLDRPDLTVMQRALLPLVIRKTLGWATRTNGVHASELHALVGGDIKQILDALHGMCDLSILQQNRIKDGEGQVQILFGLNASMVEHVNAPEASSPMPVPSSAPVSKNFYIEMPNDRYIRLKQNAIDFMVSQGYEDPSGIFDDYDDENRSQNPKALDWDAHFRTWLRRKQFKRNAQAVNTKYIPVPEGLKPDPDQFRAAEYFYHKHSQIDKGVHIPDNMQYEGYQVRLIIETTNYTLEDVIKAIDWLFSPKGDWYRPNIKTCEALRSKMDYISGHLVSYANAPSIGTEVGNILDMLEGGDYS